MATEVVATPKTTISAIEGFPEYIKELLSDINVSDIKIEDIYSKEDIGLMDLRI
jgi:hypothetical protein